MTTPSNATTHDPSDSFFGPVPRRSVGRVGLDLLTSVRLGIVLMTILFIYCTIGSAGIVYPAIGPGRWNPFDPGVWRHDMVRQWRPFELTEYEWFHTSFFNALILLICVNIIATTIRRIRLNALTAGVWMIHIGIIILAVGSYIYFGTKYEGDAPVVRQAVRIELPGAEPTDMLALPGSSASVRTAEGEWFFGIASIDPSWELLTDEDVGNKAYAVTVDVQSPKRRFMRQLLAGHPEYTEDVIPGKGRAKKQPEFEGRALVDESLKLSLFAPEQDSFWVKDSAALSARGVGEAQWSQRIITGLPRYNDTISDLNDLFGGDPEPGYPALRPHVLDLPVPAPGGAQADALGGVDVRVTGYLRYAIMHRRWMPGGRSLNPVAEITLTPPGGSDFHETLVAFDDARRSAYDHRLSFDWIESADALPQFKDAGPRELHLRVPDAGVEEIAKFRLTDLEGADRPMIPLGQTGWQYRIRQATDRLPLQTGHSVTLLIVDLINPEGKKLTRWVFEDSSRNRDNYESAAEDPHTPKGTDPRLETAYKPGRMLSTISVVAGPGDVGLHVFHDDGEGGRVQKALKPGEPVEVIYSIKLTVTRLMTDAVEIERPMIVPHARRDRDSDAAQAFALVRVELSKGDWRQAEWLPFHRYTFTEPMDPVGVLSRFEPRRFTLPEGREVDIVVGRERRPLPNAVRLDDFILTSNVGGFTGRVSSVRDWTSVVRFKGETGWSEPSRVSTNDPGTHDGVWFFQSYWDPPRAAQFAGDTGSAGLNFTGLGVGNRRGVMIQLLGCCLSVAGMIYAFYVKPIIRRRRRVHVLAEVEAGRMGRRPHAPGLDDTPIRGEEVAR